MQPNEDTAYFWTPIVEYSWAYKAESGKKIIGGVIAMPTRQGSWYINSLFVDPHHRKRGVASRLLKRILVLARGKRVFLDIKTDRMFLLEFYKKHGFTEVKVLRNYYRDGTDRFLLVRNPNRIVSSGSTMVSRGKVASSLAEAQ